ncbi:MAG: ribosome recycling factor [Bacteroidales bacterium]|nr:ribosome recycling factor [Bacteroidales bacterium]
MNEEAQLVIEQTKENMDGAIKHLDKEFHKIRAGKASPDMLEGVKVDYYGQMTPLNQVSNITTPDARQIIVQPWEKSMLGPIEKAIQAANLGFNPINNGEVLRIKVPALTEERRKELFKKAKDEAENSKISIRGFRKEANDEAKQLEKEGLAEDDKKRMEEEIQKLTDKYIEKVDKMLEDKEKDIMTV